LAQIEELRRAHASASEERDRYRELYLKLLEQYKRLENSILGQRRSERTHASDLQLSLQLLGELLSRETVRGGDAPTAPAAEAVGEDRPDRGGCGGRPKHRPTGRKPIPEHLPRIPIEILPPEVEQKGRDAFRQIGEEVTEVIERRSASVVVLEIHKPKFVPKGQDRTEPTQVQVASTPELPIERGLAGPGLLAETIVRRWQDHLPLHRLEGIYARDGLDLARSTICGWHQSLGWLARPLLAAMHEDALRAPYLCVDATGVLVQAPKQCKAGHFWVLVAPERHVLFAYSDKHNSQAVDDLLPGYKGILVADAHAVYDHLYADDDVTECGCWGHSRRYYHKALATDPALALRVLQWMQALFKIEREIATEPARRIREVRQLRSKPIVDTYFAWCRAEAEHVLDGSPIARAIGYALNQEEALRAYLDDGRLPMTNNVSERALRRIAVGRKNWLFLGTSEAGEVTSTFVSLLASCAMHKIEPWAYLRDLLCLLPSWPARRILELAPVHWRQTLEQPDAQERLARNVFRQATLGDLAPHPRKQ
jgi:transposase